MSSSPFPQLSKQVKDCHALDQPTSVLPHTTIVRAHLRTLRPSLLEREVGLTSRWDSVRRRRLALVAAPRSSSPSASSCLQLYKSSL